MLIINIYPKITEVVLRALKFRMKNDIGARKNQAS